MKKIFAICASIILLIILGSGVFSDVVKFFAWLFTLQYISPETSIVGSIIVKILTFVVSYAIVGAMFKYMGLFDGKIMSVLYFVISTLLGFALAYVVMIFETYWLFFCIAFGVIFAVLATIYAVVMINSKRRE